MSDDLYADRRRSVTTAWLDTVLPAPCVSCRGRLDDAGRPYGLCRACRARLVAWPVVSCPSCGSTAKTRALDAAVCIRCRRQPLPWQRLVTGWRYQSPIDAVVKAMKFGRLDYLGKHWGRVLARRVAGIGTPHFDAVVPVPLHWRRRLGRGYNQAALLAAPVASACAVPLRPLLARDRATPPRSRLPARARPRLGQVFTSRRRSVPRRVALVDDVLTSGATLAAAARALREGGAEEIVAITLARTPDTPIAADLV